MDATAVPKRPPTPEPAGVEVWPKSPSPHAVKAPHAASLALVKEALGSKGVLIPIGFSLALGTR